MAILVDDARWSHRDHRWAHMVSDTSLDELHAFAERLGVPRRGFERDHYDIPDEIRTLAVAWGAIPVTSREIVERLRRSGLRRPRGS